MERLASRLADFHFVANILPVNELNKSSTDELLAMAQKEMQEIATHIDKLYAIKNELQSRDKNLPDSTKVEVN